MRNKEKIVDTLKKEREAKSKIRLSIDINEVITYQELTEASFGQINPQLDIDLIKKAYKYIEHLTHNNGAVYGITTSFGGNVKNVIPGSQAHLLQYNLITSHAANVGTILPYEICKTAALLRLMTVSKGYSGVSPATIGLLSKMLRAGIAPALPAHGSMGASGDLNPLSALAYSLMGEGRVYLPDGETIVSTRVAFDKYNLKPTEMVYRDGLALINGTSVMTAVASFYLRYIERLIENSLVIGAMTIEAMQSSKKPFDKRLHELKPHRKQIAVAKVMHALLQNSKLALSHKELKEKIKEFLNKDSDSTKVVETPIDLQGGSYSMRAIPQIYQPIVKMFEVFAETINTEINAIDDNPIVLVDSKDELHGANFHGHPVAVTSDALTTAILSMANISNSRVDRMLKSHHSGLPAFLASGQPGLYLGMQGLQYTAAGITAELRGLGYPLSVNQITTNNDNQDLVSFGLQSTLKGLEVTFLLAYVLAVEYMSAGQALWLRHQSGVPFTHFSTSSKAAYDKLMALYQPKASKDQAMTESVEKVASLLLTEHLLPEKLRKALWT